MTTQKKAEILESLYEQHPDETPKQQCEKAILKYLAMREREKAENEVLERRAQIKVVKGGKSLN